MISGKCEELSTNLGTRQRLPRLLHTYGERSRRHRLGDILTAFSEHGGNDDGDLQKSGDSRIRTNLWLTRTELRLVWCPSSLTVVNRPSQVV